MPDNLIDRGDIVRVDFRPAIGSEQNGEWPALVLTPRAFHELNRKVIVCPITRNASPWPTNVMLPEGLAVTGAILVDQIRSVDRRHRGFRKIGRVPEPIVEEVLLILRELLGWTP